MRLRDRDTADLYEGRLVTDSPLHKDLGYSPDYALLIVTEAVCDGERRSIALPGRSALEKGRFALDSASTPLP